MCCWGHRGGRAQKKGGERRVGTRARVQSTLRPKMRWIIECGINTANDLGSPPDATTPLEKERKTGVKGVGKEWGEKSKEKKGGGVGLEGERERKSQLPSGGKSCY